MIRYLAAVLLAGITTISSCATPKGDNYYHYDTIEISLEEDCPYYFEEDINDGIIFFYAEWMREFEDPFMTVAESLSDLRIECTLEKKKIKRAYSTEGKLIEDATVIGLCYSKNHIWFHAGGENDEIKRLCDSSFIHELTHVAVATINNNGGDADHEGTDYKGWSEYHSNFVDRVKKELCDFEDSRW